MANTKKPTKDGGPRKSADDTSKLERLRELVAILEGSTTLTSLDYEDADIVVKLSRGGVAAPTPMVAHVPTALPAPVPVAATPAAPAPVVGDDDAEVVKSPFVGTFYRSPSPDAKPFVDAGAKVKPKQVLCIIEAMKLMNEIECEVTGTVVEILAENGQSVQYGDPLFKIAVKK
ncbi:MAG: acetyl-CoA carboxylase biotin carboxyl carrier protein [Myxococcota bacterium]